MRKRSIALVLTVVLLAAVVVGGWRLWQRVQEHFTPERCTVTSSGGEPLTLTPEQSRMSAIIVAASYRADLPEQAAVIALATAYQESGIRNLDHGDRDSLGLFQQRPDPKFDWGTAEQIMDPWYASERFYEELVKFDGWETADVNDQAQKVQRSGHPEAYRKHEANARALASAARGSTPEAITCVNFADPVADPAPIEAVVAEVPGVQHTREGDAIRLTADTDAHLWSAVHLAMLNTYDAGLTAVQVGDRRWQVGWDAWRDAEAIEGATITLGKG
ncbi:hypothetical protein [uncultured Tessaracoccus sp.]|uniref:hypothetical protein n=1 Tax=uncultured Tessaracoccus sp. TaxID=905023 RepID=UPI0025FE52CF|nr:hypothetical protein [uncultured Tessaracoccus sp.]